MTTINTHDLSLETIQSILDESFIDANTSLRTIIAVKVKEQLDTLKESVAVNLYKDKK